MYTTLTSSLLWISFDIKTAILPVLNSNMEIYTKLHMQLKIEANETMDRIQWRDDIA